jgi:hypothetical protein
MSALPKSVASAVRRLQEADSDERWLTGQIEYHDAAATKLRKERQKARAKKERAKATIDRFVKPDEEL